MSTLPEKLFVVAYRYRDSDIPDPNNEVWTLSANPDKPGWETDSGYSGYGLTKAVADEIARRYNLLPARLRSALLPANRGSQP